MSIHGPFRRPRRSALWWVEHVTLISLIVLTIIAVMQWVK